MAWAQKVQTRIGAPFDPATLSEDLRVIFGLGFFEDVQLRVEDLEGGLRVTFIVAERPFLRDVAFIGNRSLASDELRAAIDLEPGRIYNPTEVQRAVEKLHEVYEEAGYLAVRVTPDVEQFADGDARLVFTIAEGPRVTIDRIVIRGNWALSEWQIKAVMATRERRFWILPGIVQRKRLDQDVERILALYHDHGYLQARVETPELKIALPRRRATVVVDVVEGPQYRVGEITIAGTHVLPEREVRR